MSRSCDATGCSKEVDTGRFMCTKHWRLVPDAIQRTINREFRNYRREGGSLMHRIPYVNACALAVEHVASAEGQPLVNNYRNMLAILQRRAAEKRAV